MSSLRNAVKRITHKERAQPQSRSQLGILEKHKDYKERSKDYHNKQRKLSQMKERASFRNPDEFYFGMKKTKVIDGKHSKTRQAKQDLVDQRIGKNQESIKLLKSQDLSYIRMQKQKDQKKVEQLQSNLHFLQDGKTTKKRKHTVFVPSADDAKTFDAAQHFQTRPELLDRSFNRLRESQLLEEGTDVVTSDISSTALHRKNQRARDASYRELVERQNRISKLQRVEDHLQLEQQMNRKGQRKRKVVSDDGKVQYKWRRKRLG